MGCGLVFGHGIFLKGFSCEILCCLPLRINFCQVLCAYRGCIRTYKHAICCNIYNFTFHILMHINSIFFLAGFYLQILWDYHGWSCPQCDPQWPKDHVDLQTGSQAQRTSRTHLCWEEIQRSPWKGTQASQGTTFEKSNLEEEQHSLSSPLPLNCKTFLVLLLLS